MAVGDIVLGPNQYGKAECRLVKVTRDTARHEIEDLNVTSQLRGDFEACHTEGDNSQVHRDRHPEEHRLRASPATASAHRRSSCCGSAGTSRATFAWVSGGRWAAEQYAWERIADERRPLVRAQRPRDPHRRRRDRRRPTVAVTAGLKDLHGAEVHRLGVPRLPARPLHDAAGDRPTGSSPPASPRPGATAAPTSTSTRGTTTSATCCSRPSPTSTRSRSSRPSSRWARPCSRGTTRSRRSACPAPTSTTSWSTWSRSGSTTRARCSSRPTVPYGLIEATVQREGA